MNDYAVFRDIEDVLHRHGLVVVDRSRIRLAASRFRGRDARTRLIFDLEERA